MKTLKHKAPAAQAERPVSLLPSGAVDDDEIAAPDTPNSPEPSSSGRDYIEILRGFENLAAREHKYVISNCPNILRRAVEVFAQSVDPDPKRAKSMDTTIALSLDEGARLLAQTPGLKALEEARRTVLASGDDRIAWFDDFRVELGTLHQGRRHLYARVVPAVTLRISLLAETLGLPASVVACLCLQAVLIAIPTIPDAIKGHMINELSTFVRRVKARADEASTIARSVKAHPPTLTASYLDLIREPDSHDD